MWHVRRGRLPHERVTAADATARERARDRVDAVLPLERRDLGPGRDVDDVGVGVPVADRERGRVARERKAPRERRALARPARLLPDRRAAPRRVDAHRVRVVARRDERAVGAHRDDPDLRLVRRGPERRLEHAAPRPPRDDYF